jgi:hypothetical protein
MSLLRQQYEEIIAENVRLRAELAAEKRAITGAIIDERQRCAKIAGRYCEMARDAIRANNAAPSQPYCKVCGNIDCGYPACAFKP